TTVSWKPEKEHRPLGPQDVGEVRSTFGKAKETTCPTKNRWGPVGVARTGNKSLSRTRSKHRDKTRKEPRKFSSPSKAFSSIIPGVTSAVVLDPVVTQSPPVGPKGERGRPYASMNSRRVSMAPWGIGAKVVGATPPPRALKNMRVVRISPSVVNVLSPKVAAVVLIGSYRVQCPLLGMGMKLPASLASRKGSKGMESILVRVLSVGLIRTM